MTTNPNQIVQNLRDLNERDVDSRRVFNWLSEQDENRNQPLHCRVQKIADEAGISWEAVSRAITDIAEITGDDVIGFGSEQMVTFMQYETCSIGVTALGRGQLQQRPQRLLAAHAP